MLGAILVPFMGAVGSIAEGRPLMAGSTLRSLFEGDCSGSVETSFCRLELLVGCCIVGSNPAYITGRYMQAGVLIDSLHVHV